MHNSVNLFSYKRQRMSLKHGAFDPMLSRKQAWRKTKSQGCNTNINGSLPFCGARENHVDSDDEKYSSAAEDSGYISDGSKASSTTLTPMKKLRSALSMGDLSKALRSSTIRNLRFSSKVHVCLIPTRQDLQSVAMEIFWSSADYANFKREAVDELRTFLQARGITAKEAIKLLYQPDPEEVTSVLYKANSGTNLTHLNNEDPVTKSVHHHKEEELAAETTAHRNDITIGYKTDLEINKESGASTLKTPAGKGGSGPQIWAVQWQKMGSAPADHK